MGMENPVYMDHNATTAVRPAVKDALAWALDLTGNASSVHGAGRAARKHVEDAREQVAALVGAEPAGVVFTSGGTEANNLAIRGTIQWSAKRRVLVSAVEHVSVLKSVAAPEIIAVDSNGLIDLGALDAALEVNQEAALVSVMLAKISNGPPKLPLSKSAKATLRASSALWSITNWVVLWSKRIAPGDSPTQPMPKPSRLTSQNWPF